MSERPAFSLHFWPWGFILLVVLGAILMATARPLYRAAKAWRASTYLKEAQEALEKGDLNRASQRAKLCLQFKPGDSNAARVLARIGDLRRDPSSLNFWTYVVQSPHVTDADRVALGEAALRENLIMVAEQQLDTLLTRPSPPKEVYHLAGLLAFRQGKPALARSWFEKAIALDKDYVRAAINLARVRLLFPENTNARREAVAALLAIADRKDDWGLQALLILTEWALAHPDERGLFDAAVPEKLARHPLAKTREKCLAVQWQIHQNPARFDELVDKLTAGASGLAAADQRELASWLYRIGLRERLLKTFPLDPKAPEPLLLVQLDAMASLGRWKELDEFLKNDLLLDHPVLLWIFRARTAKELGSEARYDINWRQAVRAAGREPLALRYLAYYAETLGDSVRAVDAYEQLSQIPQYELEALLRLIRPYEMLGQTKKLLNTLQRLSLLKPADLVIKNDLAYLGLLTGESAVRPHERASEVYAADPQMPAFAATYALSQLKQGNPAAAARALRNIPFKDLRAPSWQAVFAAALHAAGDKEEAKTIARRIDYENLKPEERALIAEFWKPPEGDKPR